MQVFAEDGTRIDARVNERQHVTAVVLIHGFPFSASIWDAQADALAQDACVVCPDLRGAGKSSESEGPYLMETLAADVALLLDALGIERASIAGHSMGGYVALAFARMFTERVARLALVPSRLRADTPKEAQARWELADRVEREKSIGPVVESMLPRLFAPSTPAERPGVVERAYEIVTRNAPGGAAAALRGMALRSSAEDIAEDLDVPMVMIAGAQDATLTQEEAEAVVERFPRGRLVLCAESGHMPMMEEPELVSAALREWLKEALI
ncbi:MAG: alpha/beta hydrolase [Candidatus Cybelea sp.]|jgi:pimeloyl-ACP methyl ester carboxylesterase